MFKPLFPTLLLEEQLSGETLTSVTSEIDLALTNLNFSLNPEDDTGDLYISDEGISYSNNVLSRYNLTTLNFEIIRCVNMYLKETNTIPKVELKTYVAVMTLLKPGEASVKHMHQPSCIIVVYYHKTPTDCGNIRLYSPIQNDEFQKETIVDIVPTQGKILVFPGWLYHEVLKNNSDNARHSIAITIQVYKEFLQNENINT
jgi:hypothetical protein